MSTNDPNLTSTSEAPDFKTMAADYSRRSKLAFGISLICVMFGLETATAHRTNPSPASPIIWSILALGCVTAAAAGFWFRAKAAKLAEQ